MQELDNSSPAAWALLRVLYEKQRKVETLDDHRRNETAIGKTKVA